jgi:hypothetical protein
MSSHDSPLSVLRHYAILILLVGAVLVTAVTLVDMFIGPEFGERLDADYSP